MSSAPRSDATAHPVGEGDPLWLKSYPPGLKWDQDFEPEHVWYLLEKSAYLHPNRPCLEFEGRYWSYTEVLETSEYLSSGLAQTGIKTGDHVALMLPNTPFYVFFYFAVLRLGAVVVNMNPLYATRELTFLAEDSGAVLLVTLNQSDLLKKARALLAANTVPRLAVCDIATALPKLKSLAVRMFKRSTFPTAQASELTFEGLLDAGHAAGKSPVTHIDPATTVAVLQYTGGTTGRPKGAMLTHGNLSANAAQVDLWTARCGLTTDQLRYLAVIPFFHVFAMTTAMLMPIRAGSLILMQARFNVTDCLKLIHRGKPTHFPAVPTVFTAINAAPDLAFYDLSSIENCISGGAPLPVEVKRQFEDLTGCELVEGYGLSETSPVATCNPVGGNRAGSIGLPLPGTRVEIRDLEDYSRPVPMGEKGLVCIAGPQVMAGYWNRPEDTAEVFIGEFFATGDIGTMDEDGYFYIVDRLKDVILAGGYNVYPRMIEEAIHLHPAVAETTVIGVPDPYRGQTPVAYVKLKADAELTEADLLAFLKDQLSPIERPSRIEFRDELPKTLIGKPSKKELREEVHKEEAHKEADTENTDNEGNNREGVS